MKTYSQQEIEELIQCGKVITGAPKKELTLENGHYRNSMDLESKEGLHKFHVFMRKNEHFEENFTIGIDYLPEDGSGRVCLLRCNGPHGEHVNSWMSTEHYFGCHVHVAREEHIGTGLKSEMFAELTQEYSTFFDALEYFLSHCNIIDAEKYFPFLQKQLKLFTEG